MTSQGPSQGFECQSQSPSLYSSLPFTGLSSRRSPPSVITKDHPQSSVYSIDQAVCRYFVAALSSSTHKTYKAAERRYLQFCNNFSLTPLPVSENILCYFVACMGQEGLAGSSIRTYLSGIRQLQVAAGFQDPHLDQMPRLSQVLKGVKVLAAGAGRQPRSRLPITPSILRMLRQIWMSGIPTFNNTMLWAAASTTFFGFCRSGEITVESETNYDPQIHLSFADLAVDNATSPTVISIQLKRSKTDPFMKGVKLVLGRTQDGLCPVTALLSYLAIRGNASGPLFMWDDLKPLSKTKFIEHVRQALQSANIPAHLYSGHSFRIGAATTAASAGIADSVIQTLGRWQSSAYLLYVKLRPDHLANLSSTMAQCPI